MKTWLVVGLLLVAGACGKKAKDAGGGSSTGQSQSTLSLSEQFLSAIETNQPRKAEEALTNGANPNIVLTDGSTPLTYSIIRNQASMVDVLLRLGADPEKIDKNGQHPLLLALKNKNDTMARLLVVHGAEINVRDNRGRTPLMLAIIMEEAELAEWLLERGADINLRDSMDRDALSLAREFGLSQLATTLQVRLLRVGGGSDAEIVGGLFEREDVMALREFLLRRPEAVKLNYTPSLLVRALNLSHTPSSVEAIELLLGHGLSVEGQEPHITTPLILAAKAGKLQQMRTFLRSGADIEAKDESGKTALMNAILQRQQGIVEHLIELKAEKNYETPGQSGRVKHQACLYGRQARDTAANSSERKTSESILKALGCGIRGLFSIVSE